MGRSSKPSADFEVQFKTGQDLEIFQIKLARLTSSIDANIDAIQVCQDCWRSADRASLDKRKHLMQLSHLQRQLGFYSRSIQRLAERAQGAASLVREPGLVSTQSH